MDLIDPDTQKLIQENAALKARDDHNWRTLRECADILCLPDESPSLLPEKIRVLQACLLSEKRAKVERGEMVEELRKLVEAAALWISATGAVERANSFRESAALVGQPKANPFGTY